MSVRLDDVLLALAECLGSGDEWTTAIDVGMTLGQSLPVTQTELQLLEAEGYAEEDDAYVWTLTEMGFERVNDLKAAGR